MKKINVAGNLQVAESLYRLVNQQIIPGTSIKPEDFWQGLSEIITEMSPENRQLLQTRDRLQQQIDQWHQAHLGAKFGAIEYRHFLEQIGYLHQTGENFVIDTENVDTEITLQAGPQLVVPVKNARFALNAANARWGSLYDALYGTDVITEQNGARIKAEYNPIRGAKVIEFGRNFLDQATPLKTGSHAQATAYKVVSGQLLIVLENAETTTLAAQNQFIGYQGDAENPESVLLKNHGLHIDIRIDPRSAIGQQDKAGVHDLLMEAAITTIQDFEDSVAAVDAQDKTQVYSNWLGLIKGDLSETFEKNGKMMTRVLNPDREYTAADGRSLTLPGRSLLFVRNVGHLMTSDAIIDAQGKAVYEGIMDAAITGLISLHDLNTNKAIKNSRSGSIYIVKPKMHGPDEVAFTCRLFARVESLLGMPEKTMKIGIMDEERRTTVNLKECIRAAKSRVVFINTGFLDRTGDEIHTSMKAGAMVPKGEMKNQKWMPAYEDWNVDIGLACGLAGKAQIGKGMWAMPDFMAKMLKEKIAHPQAGANTAWVPSPTAAVLHALHYHQVDVFARQAEIAKRRPAKLEDILTIPLLKNPASLSRDEIHHELENNTQGILGYVVRWIEQGIGCSTVPDLKNIGLMEDRATLRISSQHIANWLYHGICSTEMVSATLQKMAEIVDRQNASDPLYIPMSTDFDNSIAFQAASDLIFKGCEQPNGYTEPLLHTWRIKQKLA